MNGYRVTISVSGRTDVVLRRSTLEAAIDTAREQLENASGSRVRSAVVAMRVEGPAESHIPTMATDLNSRSVTWVPIVQVHPVGGVVSTQEATLAARALDRVIAELTTVREALTQEVTS